MLNYFFVILVFSLFILLPIKVKIKIAKNRDNEYILIEALGFKIVKTFFKTLETKISVKSFISLLSFEFKINSNRNNLKQTKAKTLTEEIYEMIVNAAKAINNKNKNLKKINIFLFKHIDIICINIYVTFGSDNAALTGLLAGKIWGVIYLVLSVCTFYFNFRSPDIKVNVAPIFQNYRSIQIDANCIFRFRVGHIIIVCFIALWHGLTRVKFFKTIY